MFGMGNGMNGWEGYQLGRRSVENEQVIERFAANLRARFDRTPVIDVHAVMAHNQALAAQNQALRTRVDELQQANALLVYKHHTVLDNYERLEDWAARAMSVLREHGLIKEGN